MSGMRSTMHVCKCADAWSKASWWELQLDDGTCFFCIHSCIFLHRYIYKYTKVIKMPSAPKQHQHINTIQHISKEHKRSIKQPINLTTITSWGTLSTSNPGTNVGGPGGGGFTGSGGGALSRASTVRGFSQSTKKKKTRNCFQRPRKTIRMAWVLSCFVCDIERTKQNYGILWDIVLPELGRNQEFIEASQSVGYVWM